MNHHDESPVVLPRRSFLRTAGTATLSAAAIALLAGSEALAFRSR